MERPTGGFVKLLSKQKAMKPKGDEDPIPQEWKDDVEMDEAAEEAAWVAQCAATAPVAIGQAEQMEPETYEEEAEEEDTTHADDQHVDQDEEQRHDEESHEDEKAEEMEDEEKQEEEESNKSLHAKEYEDMDKDRAKLAKYLQNEKKRKLSPDDTKDYDATDDTKDNTKDADQDHGWKYRNRNKGYGNYYGNKGGYGQGYGRSWWPKGKGKGKQKNKGKYNKWQWSQSDDWQWSGGKGDASSHAGGGPSSVLRADNKGGYYLPHGQGAGEGLKAQGKSRVRGGVKIQQAKHNQKMAEERKQQDEHSRSLTMKLAQITEKALDKLPS